MKKLDSKILDGLLKIYGEEEQLLQAMGECGELVAVIQNYLRAKKYGRRTETLANVMEEAVDVFFMTQQIRQLDCYLFDSIEDQKSKIIIEKFKKGKIK